MIDMWVQYTHLDKLYGYLPGMSEAIPAIFGMEPAAYAALVAGFDAQAEKAAHQLLGDDRFAAQVDALPFVSGQSVLVVGDSVTDDLQSWAEVLRRVLDLRHPGLRVTNGGLSAHTTSMVLRRWPSMLASRPDWIFCLLGSNDVTRVGPEPTKTQVSVAESAANLVELRRIAAARTDASWVWITPPPVLEDRVAEFPAFKYGESRWRNSDILALTEAIRAVGGGDPVVDLSAVFGVPTSPDLQGPDGVHPSIDGQIAIVRALVERLAPRQPVGHDRCPTAVGHRAHDEMIAARKTRGGPDTARPTPVPTYMSGESTSWASSTP